MMIIERLTGTILTLCASGALVASGCASDSSRAGEPPQERMAAPGDKSRGAESADTGKWFPVPAAGGQASTSVDAAKPAEPETGMVLYRRAQAQAKEGKYDEAFATAQSAMAKFVQEKNKLAWMMIESIERPDRIIDVHFNMGPKERAHAEGINNVLTFRVWAKDRKSMLGAIDYEHAIFNGKAMTAAFGVSNENGHINYGMIDPGSSYTKVRERAIEVIDRVIRVPGGEAAKPAEK